MNLPTPQLVRKSIQWLLEILEDRHRSRSTIVTSQLPVDQWHDNIGDSTMADAIMDRLVHNAYKINLKGESLRKKQANLTTSKLNFRHSDRRPLWGRRFFYARKIFKKSKEITCAENLGVCHRHTN
jgi:hypothetical protein